MVRSPYSRLARLIAALLGFFSFTATGSAQCLEIEELEQIRDNLRGSYCLAKNIDAAVSEQDGAPGFVPIGTKDDPFIGTFDGRGHVIDKLTVERSNGEHVGLFGYVGSEGLIENVALNDVKISGTGSVGALAGHNAGEVRHSSASGTVSGMGYVGGLVGENSGTISSSFATAAVKATGSGGGLVGYNTNLIQQSFAWGSVDATGEESSAGGLVARNHGGTIEQSYASGAVTGASAAGLVRLSGPGGTIKETYAAGRVQSVKAAAGLVLESDRSSISSSYWDLQATGQSGSAAGEGLTTAELQTALPEGFDRGVWGILSNKTYPRLLAGPFTFPLADDTASTAEVTSVFDHSMRGSENGSAGPYRCDEQVLARSGDVGTKINGSNGKFCKDHPGYAKAGNTAFEVNGLNYVGSGGANNYLNYDGHPGYDYRSKCGTEIYSAVAGEIHYPTEIVGASGRANHVLALTPDADPTYRIYYLHLLTYPNSAASQAEPTLCERNRPGPYPLRARPGCYKAKKGEFTQTTLPLEQGVHVEPGCLIGLSGDAGGVPPHLHFEVQRAIPRSLVGDAVGHLHCKDSSLGSQVCLPLDPYGWENQNTRCTGSWSGDEYRMPHRHPKPEALGQRIQRRPAIAVAGGHGGLRPNAHSKSGGRCGSASAQMPRWMAWCASASVATPPSPRPSAKCGRPECRSGSTRRKGRLRLRSGRWRRAGWNDGESRRILAALKAARTLIGRVPRSIRTFGSAANS